MNDFHLPEWRRARQSEAQRSPRSTASIAVGSILSLAMLSASVRPAAAEAIADSNDASAATAEEKDENVLADPVSDKWRFTLGGGVINEARYPGSRDYFTHGLPLVGVSYGRYFFGATPGGGAPAGAGAYLVHTEHWAVGVNIGAGVRKPRRASDAPILHGWGDIPSTARGGMFASYTIDWLSIRGSITDAVSHHEGVLASFAIEAKYHATQRLTFSIGPEITWGNNQYTQTFFGIDAAQSQIAGVAPYQAKSGINTVGGSAGATYMLTDHWSLGTHVSYGRLQGDAANSPVTTDKTQRLYSGFFMYHF